MIIMIEEIENKIRNKLNWYKRIRHQYRCCDEDTDVFLDNVFELVKMKRSKGFGQYKKYLDMFDNFIDNAIFPERKHMYDNSIIPGTEREWWSPFNIKCLAHIEEICELDIESGLKFARVARLIHDVYMPDTLYYGSIYLDPKSIDFIKEYTKLVKLLIDKTKIHGDEEFKPEGSLAKILDPKNARMLRNPVLINYLFEDRLPVFSWSASSGKEMMNALTSIDYRASYDAEMNLIEISVRNIGERYG